MYSQGPLKHYIRTVPSLGTNQYRIDPPASNPDLTRTWLGLRNLGTAAVLPAIPVALLRTSYHGRIMSAAAVLDITAFPQIHWFVFALLRR